MISTGQMDVVRQILPEFARFEAHRWEHWLTKLMQNGKLHLFIDIIPNE